ncbi:hypothetical protein FRC07_012128 [Ceratobasidium sp. 392]|nr:hypothetical protein FRC07_012128 [Ceratobasidium sp. 392]
MSVPLNRQNSLNSNGDEHTVADADDANSMAYPQPLSDGRPPPRRVSFSRSVRPSRSRLGGDATPLATPRLGSNGIPLGERIQSIPESVARMSISIPTGLSQPEATPLPVVPMIVLSITMMGEFLSANVSAPWALFMVKGFGVDVADIGLWTGILISVFFITQFATSLLWASIAERFGRRLVLFISLVGSGLTCIAFGTSKSLAFALATRLLQGVFGGAVGVARGSVTSISDSTNEAQAYAILGFCWGFGGVGGAIIGGAFESPANKWTLFQHIPLFIEFPYLLPTIVAASITVTGGLLALTLDRDGGPRTSGAFDSRTGDHTGPISSAEVGLSNPTVESQGVPNSNVLTRSTIYPTRRIAESTPFRLTSGAESYGAIESSVPAAEQTEPRLGVPLGERTWTQSSAVSGGSGYGDMYRSRFGVGVRHRGSTMSWASAVARRHIGADEGLSDMYADIEPEEREPRLTERILLGESWACDSKRWIDGVTELRIQFNFIPANELAVSTIGDLWVASALTMDVDEDQDVVDPSDHFTFGPVAETAPESQHGSAISEMTTRARSAEPRARSVSASRRTVRSIGGAPFRNNRPYSLVPSANNSASRLVSFPAIMYNTGLRSPSPAFDLVSEAPDPSGASNVEVLQPIFEGKPAGFETQEAETGEESVFFQLPLTMIFQYGLLALHSTTHDQVFMSYLVSESDRGGLQLTAGDFAQLIAMMCFAQIVFQFYFYPMMGPPLGRFSHLSMFRIGGVLMAMSYLGVIFVRPLAKSGANGTAILTALGLPTAIRYCGITFSYTAVAVLLNYMSPPHAIGMANGLAQSIVSLARFMGPLWSFSTHADPEGFAFGFGFCAAFCILAVLHSFVLH